MPEHITDGVDIRVGHLITLLLGHISHIYVLCLIHLNLVSKVSSTVLPSRGVRPTSLSVVAGKREGQLLYPPQVPEKIF